MALVLAAFLAVLLASSGGVDGQYLQAVYYDSPGCNGSVLVVSTIKSDQANSSCMESAAVPSTIASSGSTSLTSSTGSTLVQFGVLSVSTKPVSNLTDVAGMTPPYDMYTVYSDTSCQSPFMFMAVSRNSTAPSTITLNSGCIKTTYTNEPRTMTIYIKGVASSGPSKLFLVLAAMTVVSTLMLL